MDQFTVIIKDAALGVYCCKHCNLKQIFATALQKTRQSALPSKTSFFHNVNITQCTHCVDSAATYQKELDKVYTETLLSYRAVDVWNCLSDKKEVTSPSITTVTKDRTNSDLHNIIRSNNTKSNRIPLEEIMEIKRLSSIHINLQLMTCVQIILGHSY